MSFKLKSNFFLFSLLLFLLIPTSLFCFVRDFVEGVKVVHVNSLKQKIVGFDKVLLDGEVEVLIDQKMHIWADQVEIDKEKQFLVAQSKQGGSVVIENNDFLILADKLFLDLDKKTGYADNIRIHVAEGYIKAGRAEKLGENQWKMEDMLFTPCDGPIPHWSITARSAKLYSNYFVKITGVLFKAGEFPFFMVPVMILPIQNRSKSGFLLPKLSHDEEWGFGIREDFYWSIAPRCDSTISVDWKEKKGIAFLDEFRWVRSPESFTLLNGQYALEKNAFVKRRDKIVKGADKRYWIAGKDFRPLDKIVPGINLKSLLRLDFGTDKRIGYHFFDNSQGVDDTFYNSWILRSTSKSDLLNITFDGSKTSRRKFLTFSDTQLKEILRTLNFDVKDLSPSDIFSKKREVEDKFIVSHLPHIEWNSIYRNVKNLFSYKHDFFIDRVFSRERKLEKFYIQSKVVGQNDLVPLAKADSFRFFYHGDLQKAIKFKDYLLRFYLEPHFDLRSNIKDKFVKAKKNVIEGGFLSQGAYRVFFEGGAEFALPELLFEDKQNKYLHYFQPTFNWSFLPKFKQDHWYFSDKWDKWYARNQLELYVRNNWYFDNMQLDFNVAQAYDFYNRSDIYPLVRCPKQNNLLPLKLEFGLGFDVVSLFVAQEYSWKNFQLLQSEINYKFSLNKFEISVTALYQHEKLQKERELFSDVPHFVLLDISVPILEHVTLSYEAQFYSQRDSKLFPFEGLRPLLHRIGLDYRGHCWGISFGFEEKRYKQYGNWKSDKAFTLFVRLDSLGSFARKFKRPTAYARK